ncbi:hypothetical protein NPS70_17615 [Streptomyces sp. C10-9-1]|uniref:hypothetical protein n=1 Tax=Streptomyces sp. C10-9-1 TaxID=1859285 RepID=UPI002111765B|nr:hypothetical protein [Streptomyces sp. C10-9-1]MCQ6554997.1 hypothetical protein [Streptomyces sp. C10-9-1]
MSGSGRSAWSRGHQPCAAGPASNSAWQALGLAGARSGQCREESTAEVEAAVADGTELSTSLPPHCQGLPVRERDQTFAESADDAIADEMDKAREDIERLAADTGYEK